MGTVGQVISCIVVGQRNIGLAIDGTEAQQWTRAAGPPAFAQPYATKAHSRCRRDGADAVRYRGIAVQTRRHPHGDTEHVRNQPARQHERIITLLDPRRVKCGLVRHGVDACKRVARPGIPIERMANARQRPSDGARCPGDPGAPRPQGRPRTRATAALRTICRATRWNSASAGQTRPTATSLSVSSIARYVSAAQSTQSAGVSGKSGEAVSRLTSDRPTGRHVPSMTRAQATEPLDQGGAGRELLPLGRLDLFGLRGRVGAGQHAAQCRDPGVDAAWPAPPRHPPAGYDRQPQQPAILAADGQECRRCFLGRTTLQSDERAKDCGTRREAHQMMPATRGLAGLRHLEDIDVARQQYPDIGTAGDDDRRAGVAVKFLAGKTERCAAICRARLAACWLL